MQRAADLRGQLGDPCDEGLERGDEAEHDLAARFGLEAVGAAVGGAAESGQQFVWGASGAVAVAGEEPRETPLAEAASVRGRWVALDERERNRTVDLGEYAGGR